MFWLRNKKIIYLLITLKRSGVGVCRKNIQNVVLFYITCIAYGSLRKKNVTLLHANNRDADQTAHLHSLISAFVIGFFESIIVKLAPCRISLFYLVSVAEHFGQKP